MDGLKKIALALDCATDVLVFGPSARPIADDLQHQFEAISKLPEDERAIARHLLEGWCSSPTPSGSRNGGNSSR